MKRFTIMFCLTLMTASLAFAQPAAPKPAAETPAKVEAKPEAKPEAKAAALPTVDEALAKYVKASGGEEALKKITSRTAKGTFDLPAMGANGTFETMAKAPNLSFTKIEIAGFGAITNVYDGKSAWSQDPMSGLRELKGAELVMTQIQSDFYRELRMKELYKSLTVKGREKLASGSVIVIEAVPSEGSPEKYYFDETTGLLVRHDAEVESPQGKMPTETVYEDYKVVDGVNTWHTMKMTNPAVAFTIKIEEMKSNVPVDAAKFTKPAGQ